MSLVSLSDDASSAKGPQPQPESSGGYEMAEVFGDELQDLHLNLWDAFAVTAREDPDSEAVVSLWQHSTPLQGTPVDASDEQNGLRWSYNFLRLRAESMANSLASRGCKPGMRLAAVLWNSAEWPLFFWTATKIGMTFVPIDPTSAQDARNLVASVKPHLIIAHNADSAKNLRLVDSHLSQPCIRFHCSKVDLEGWESLPRTYPELYDPMAPLPNENDNQQNVVRKTGDARVAEDDAMIVFTSGTTGTPKGCLHTHRNLIAQSCDFDPEKDPPAPLRWLVHTPASHIFAVNNMLRAWRHGGTVVFPSKSFEVGATLKALVQEKCSVISCTPTLVKALLAHPDFPGPDKLHIRLATIGGTNIGPADIRLCREGLGAINAIQAYGMSEGAPVISWRRTDTRLVDGYHAGVGTVLPGANARICRPGTKEVLPRGEVGELHIGGPSVIDKYVGAENDEALYWDEHGNWLMTGDQAEIDKDGIIHILGRYKDIIIRGGENVYPLKIESTLSHIPGLQVQVVGASDEIAGQIPVAVVKMPDGVTKTQILEESHSLGARYVLDAVYTLEELGLQSFPVTSLGKVKKEKLRRAVAALRKANEPVIGRPVAYTWELPQNSTKPLTEILVDLWEQLSGTRPSKDESIIYLSDSITLLRYCDSVLRYCGKRIYLQDFADHDTIEKQAQLLIMRDQRQANFSVTSATAVTKKIKTEVLHRRRFGAFRKRSDHHTSRPQQSYASPPDCQIWPSAEKMLAHFGIDESGIEDIVTVRETLLRMLDGQRPQSYHTRMVFWVDGIGGEEIRRGLEEALISRPMLRSIAYNDPKRKMCQAILSPSQTLFDQLIHEMEVDTEYDAVILTKDDSRATHSGPFMFRADLVRIRETGDHYLSMTYNHAVIDALSMTPWHHDLDRLIQDEGAQVPALTPYKLFADLISQYEESAPAKKCVAYHVKKLRGISRFQQALWPPQMAPGWMVSNDENSIDFFARNEARKQVWNGEWETRAPEFQYPRCGRVLCLPQLNKLKQTHGIEPSLFAKSALVIFNILQTGSSYALFNTFESGRSWPFVPDWMEMLLPPAMSIDGPTLQWVLNMTEVIHDETILEFLQRLNVEREELRENQHAPWDQIIRDLGDEGDTALDASYRQAFVWDMSMGFNLSRGLRDGFTSMHPIARYDWGDCGIFWNAFMADKENLYFIASWDTAQMNDVEVEQHCDNLAAIMRNLAKEDNWGKTVKELFSE